MFLHGFIQLLITPRPRSPQKKNCPRKKKRALTWRSTRFRRDGVNPPGVQLRATRIPAQGPHGHGKQRPTDGSPRHEISLCFCAWANANGNAEIESELGRRASDCAWALARQNPLQKSFCQRFVAQHRTETEHGCHKLTSGGPGIQFLAPLPWSVEKHPFP